jgi:hypothetical protein
MKKGNKMNLIQKPDNLKNIKSNYRPNNIISKDSNNLNMNYSTNYKKEENYYEKKKFK